MLSAKCEEKRYTLRYINIYRTMLYAGTIDVCHSQPISDTFTFTSLEKSVNNRSLKIIVLSCIKYKKYINIIY